MSNMTNTYDQILCLKEAKDFSRVIVKWETLYRNLAAQGKKFPLVLPDLLWVAKSGVGKSNLLRLLSDYLSERETLMEFSGDVRYIEFKPEYVAPEYPFTEIAKLIDQLVAAAGFRNSFKGLIALDLDEWLEHCEEKHFISFLEYLTEISADKMLVFTVSDRHDAAALARLESVLAMLFRIEKSKLCFPDTKELMQFVANRLSTYAISLDDSAEALICETVEKLRENKYFDGYKTLLMLCDDIAYEIYSTDNPCTVATAKTLGGFAPDSAYVATATHKSARREQIGLVH